MADLGAEDLWYIGDTRRLQFTAHYLACPLLHLAFSSAGVIPPSSSLSYVSRRFLLLFSNSDGCTIFSASASISFFLLLFRTSISPPLLYFSLSFYIWFFLFFFHLFFQYVLLFSSLFSYPFSFILQILFLRFLLISIFYFFLSLPLFAFVFLFFFVFNCIY